MRKNIFVLIVWIFMKEKLFIHCGRKTVSVNLADIIMVESYEGMSKFSIANKSPLIWADSLSHVMHRLPEGFHQINRNIIINSFNIEAIDWPNLNIQLKGGLKVKMSHRRKKDLKVKLEGIVNYEKIL